MDCADCPSVVATPDTSITYVLKITTVNGCTAYDSIHIEVIRPVKDLGLMEICPGDSIYFGGRHIKDEGLYYDTINAASDCDSIILLDIVLHDEPQPDITGEVFVCSGDSVLLEVNPYAAYSWSNQTDDQSTLVHEEGWYSVTVTDDFGCRGTDSIWVSEILPPVVSLERFHETCRHASDGRIIIHYDFGGSGDIKYFLNATEVNEGEIIGGLPSGSYSLVVVDSLGCQDEYVFSIEDGSDLTVDLGPDIQLVYPDTMVKLLATVGGSTADEVSWEWGDETFVTNDLNHTVATSGERQVIVTVIDSNNCRVRDTILIYVDIPDDIFVPNAFTPNEDGVNDKLIVYGAKGAIEIHEMSIYDRWGELVYKGLNLKPNDENGHYWDGRFNNQPLSPAVFVYAIKYSSVGENQRMVTGSFALLK